MLTFAIANLYGNANKRNNLNMSNRTRFPSFKPLALLDQLITRVELSDTQQAKVRQSYNAVSEVLKNSKMLGSLIRDLYITAQGSVRAGTTIKPVGQHEFDLDMLCIIQLINPSISPSQLLKIMWDALGEHQTYRDMRRPKDRCVRLAYKGDCDYHLDITPSRPDTPPPLLVVPDKSNYWSSTNPIGLCDDWFLPIAEKMPPVLISFSAVNNEAPVIKGEVRVEPLREYGEFEKKPLQRLVQLAKHDRDNHYSASNKLRPSSVLLTVLIAKAYDSAVREAFDSLPAFVIEVLRRVPAFIKLNDDRRLPRYQVANPVNPVENFADSWTDEKYRAFLGWHSQLLARTSLLLTTPVLGVDPAVKLLESNFPSAKTLGVVDHMCREARSIHDAGQLAVKAAPTAALYSAVSPTIYYGSHD